MPDPNVTPNVKDIAEEVSGNPRAFAVRFAEMHKDVTELRSGLASIQTTMQRGMWLALTVLIGVVVNLVLMLQDQAAQQALETARIVARALGAG